LNFGAAYWGDNFEKLMKNPDKLIIANFKIQPYYNDHYTFVDEIAENVENKGEGRYKDINWYNTDNYLNLKHLKKELFSDIKNFPKNAEERYDELGLGNVEAFGL